MQHCSILKSLVLFWYYQIPFFPSKFWAIIWSGTSQRPRAQLFQCRSESFYPKIVTVDISVLCETLANFQKKAYYHTGVKFQFLDQNRKKSDCWWKLPKSLIWIFAQKTNLSENFKCLSFRVKNPNCNFYAQKLWTQRLDLNWKFFDKTWTFAIEWPTKINI